MHRLQVVLLISDVQFIWTSELRIVKYVYHSASRDLRNIARMYSCRYFAVVKYISEKSSELFVIYSYSIY